MDKEPEDPVVDLTLLLASQKGHWAQRAEPGLALQCSCVGVEEGTRCRKWVWCYGVSARAQALPLWYASLRCYLIIIWILAHRGQKYLCETMRSFSHLNIDVMNLLFIYFLKPSLTEQKDRREILGHCQMPSKFRLWQIHLSLWNNFTGATPPSSVAKRKLVL